MKGETLAVYISMLARDGCLRVRTRDDGVAPVEDEPPSVWGRISEGVLGWGTRDGGVGASEKPPLVWDSVIGGCSRMGNA